MTDMSSSENGFSLAETMVALFILALVSTAGSGMLLGATSSGAQVRERDAGMRQLEIAEALIRNDIFSMSARAVAEDYGYGNAGNLYGRSAPSPEPVLQFVRSGWINPENREPRSGLQLVRYRLESNQLVRGVAVRPDETSTTPHAERVLLNDVSRVQTRFRRGIEWSDEWIGDGGQPLYVLPDLIELEIVFEDSRTLIIAAPTGVRS